MALAVVFDFYGTLARAVSWGSPVQDVLSQRGHQVEQAAYEAWQAEVFDGMEHIEHSRTRQDYLSWERGRLRRLARRSGVGTDDIEELAAELHAAIGDFRLEAYDEVAAVLDALRRQDLTMAVCSNWGWDLDRAMAMSGLDDRFDVVVTSAQVGVRKPHPKIFEITVERCGVAPGDTLFVGDTWYPDVEGALAAGLRPVHVWRPEDHHVSGLPPPVTAGVHRVDDLRGLLDLV